MADRNREEEKKAAEKKFRDSIDLGHRAGEAFQKQQEAARKKRL